MKSFQAKMYVEDGMATMDFDIHVLGTETDEELMPYFGFMLSTPEPTDEEREKYSMPEKPPVFLGVFDVDTMKHSGEMLSKINNEPFSVIKEETIKFLELYIEGKVCEKHNFIFPPGVKRTVMNDKHVQNGDKWDVFGVNPDTGDTANYSYPRSAENEAEIIAEAKQNLEAVRNDEMPKKHPDGTPGQDWSVTYDKDGDEIVRPYKKED